MSPSRPGVLVDPAGPWTQHESPGRAGRLREISDMVASHLGEVVTQDCWSFLQAFRPRPESPRTASPQRGPSNPLASRLGELVDNAVP